jgi:hypothetical protein
MSTTPRQAGRLSHKATSEFCRCRVRLSWFQNIVVAGPKRTRLQRLPGHV